MVSLFLDKVKLALIVTVVALSVGLWYTVRASGAQAAKLQQATEALARAQEQRKLDSRVVAAAQAEKAVQRRKSGQAEQAVSEAAGASEAWAGTSVPPDVREALSGALEGLQ